MIRPGKKEEINEIMQCIYDARSFLKASGSTQWNGPLGYPNINTLLDDIDNNICYVCVRDNVICGVAAFAGIEEEYMQESANWVIKTDKYTTIHRIAVLDKYRGQGVAKEILKFAEEYAKSIGNLSIRIDTHPKNKVVQGLVTKLGYKYCGEIIYSRIPVEPTRLIYEKVLKA